MALEEYLLLMKHIGISGNEKFWAHCMLDNQCFNHILILRRFESKKKIKKLPIFYHSPLLCFTLSLECWWSTFPHTFPNVWCLILKDGWLIMFAFIGPLSSDCWCTRIPLTSPRTWFLIVKDGRLIMFESIRHLSLECWWCRIPLTFPGHGAGA